jgi:hypothetical protein
MVANHWFKAVVTSVVQVGSIVVGTTKLGTAEAVPEAGRATTARTTPTSAIVLVKATDAVVSPLLEIADIDSTSSIVR